MSARVIITGARGGIGAAAMAELRARGATRGRPRPRARRRRTSSPATCATRRSVDARGRRGDRAARRARRADQQRRPRHAAERRRGARRRRAGGARRQPDRPVARDRRGAAALRESRGRVVNVASGLAHVAVPFATAYCMSKRGLVAYSDALRLEHGDAITVTTVYPGYIRTPIHDASKAAGVALEGAVPAERRRATPRGRSCAPRSGGRCATSRRRARARSSTRSPAARRGGCSTR